jgi:dTDP-4-dehydrorhamnose reductase
MRHLVLGKGNLGCDLFEVLSTAPGNETVLGSRSVGMDFGPLNFSTAMDHLRAVEPNVIWVCIGGYSVESAETDFISAQWNLVTMPILLLNNAPPNAHVVLFSSDYCASEKDPSNPFAWQLPPRSVYAALQQNKEHLFAVTNRKNSSLLRVGSLYGHHYEDRCLHGKLLAKKNASFELPTNTITPTWTRWLAETVRDNMFQILIGDAQVGHIAPAGNVSVFDFARMILPRTTDVSPKGIDVKRPRESRLHCSFGKTEPAHWTQVWNDFILFKESRGTGTVTNISDYKLKSSRRH